MKRSDQKQWHVGSTAFALPYSRSQLARPFALLAAVGKMTSELAIADERDLHYAGTWYDAGSPAEYSGTTRWTSIQGSTASFTFEGTSVSIRGTVAAKTSPQASLSFSVDNSVTGTFTPASDMVADIHHLDLWTSPTLGNGSHTLVITQTTAQDQGVIFLDYLLYNTTSTAVPSYLIDDRDPRITYTPEWRKFTGETDFLHTSQESSSPGDSFSLSFKGQSVSFYGGIPASNAGVMNASIVLDGARPIYFIAPTNPPAATNNLIFESGVIADGNHTLVVTSENQYTVWTDYFLITPSTSSASSSASSAADSVPSAQTIKKSTPIGEIVGPVIGVVLLIALATAAFFFLRRRKRRRDLQPADFPMEHAIIPFSDTGHSTGASSSGSGFHYSAVATGPESASGAAFDHSMPAVTASSSLDHSAPFADPAPAASLPPFVPVRSNKLAAEVRRWHAPSSSSSSSRSGPASAAGSSRLDATHSAVDVPPPQYSE